MKANLRGLCVSLVLALTGVGTASAQTTVQAAIDHVDLAGLRAAGAASAEPAKSLAAAVELSWLHRDAAALTALTAAAKKQTDPTLKAAALTEIANVEMRQGQFVKAALAAKQAADITGKATPAAAQQTLAFLQALSGEQPTKAAGKPSGRVAVTRDMVKLPRADIVVNGKTQDAVLDTGANFSTIVESAAQKLGLRPLKAAVSIGSTYTDKLDSKLAVADKLSIGGAEFTNVVFIVLPDSALTLLGGKYKIEAILGMPVFLQMHRIGISKQDNVEWFTFGRGDAKSTAEPNLLFNGLGSIVVARADGAPLNLLVDSGANTSSLNGRFATDFADRMAAAQEGKGAQGGAGGVNYDVKQRKLSDFPISVGGKIATLSSIAVGEDVQNDRHGALGEDVLGLGFTMDFDAARLDIKP